MPRTMALKSILRQRRPRQNRRARECCTAGSLNCRTTSARLHLLLPHSAREPLNSSCMAWSERGLPLWTHGQGTPASPSRCITSPLSVPLSFPLSSSLRSSGSLAVSGLSLAASTDVPRIPTLGQCTRPPLPPPPSHVDSCRVSCCGRCCNITCSILGAAVAPRWWLRPVSFLVRRAARSSLCLSPLSFPSPLPYPNIASASSTWPADAIPLFLAPYHTPPP